MSNLAAVAVLAIMALKMGWYLPLVLKRVVTPLPATYVIAAAGIHLAWWSYWSIPGRTITENIVLFSAVIEISLTLGVIALVSWRRGDWGHPFDLFQKISLLAMLVIFLCWFTNRELAKATFWSTQALLVVAYMATIMKVQRKKVVFDSTMSWGLLFLGSLVGTIPAFIMGSPYGVFNSTRSTISSGVLFSFLLFFGRRADWRQWKAELTFFARLFTKRRAL